MRAAPSAGKLTTEISKRRPTDIDHPAAFLLLILSAAAHAEADGKAVDRSMLQGREHRVSLRVPGGKLALNTQALFRPPTAEVHFPIGSPHWWP